MNADGGVDLCVFFQPLAALAAKTADFLHSAYILSWASSNQYLQYLRLSTDNIVDGMTFFPGLN